MRNCYTKTVPHLPSIQMINRFRFFVKIFSIQTVSAEFPFFSAKRKKKSTVVDNCERHFFLQSLTRKLLLFLHLPADPWNHFYIAHCNFHLFQNPLENSKTFLKISFYQYWKNLSRVFCTVLPVDVATMRCCQLAKLVWFLSFT